MQHADLVRARASKYGGFVSLLVAIVNIAFGALLVWVTFTEHGGCVMQVPLFIQVAGWTSLVYGTVFGLYAIVSIIRATRRAGYEEVEQDSVFGDSVFDRANLSEVARPGCWSTLGGCGMFLGKQSAFVVEVVFLLTTIRLVGAFRLAWLIFGSVQVFNVTDATCHGYYTPAFIYVTVQWSLMGIFVLVACCGCICLAYCATLIGHG
jgi:hypothetical protein